MLVVLCWLVVVGVCRGLPSSPCPQYFGYWASAEGGVLGKVTIPATGVLPLNLRVHLTLRAALKTKYVGILMLSEHPTLVLGNLLTQKAKSVNYTIRFPLPNPLPLLEKIILNNKTICTAEKTTSQHFVYGGVLTNILLEHTFPASELHLSRKFGDEYQNEEKYKIETTGIDCGRSEVVDVPRNDIQLSKWPWLVAVFLKEDSGFRFQCAGNLISDRHVVTAAHCIKNQKNKNWSSKDFVVYFGNHNLEKFMEKLSQIRQVNKIIIHPEYNETKYVADIALIKFEAVTFNDLVSPVCVWNEGTSLKPLIGHLGTVVGWGVDDSTQKMRPQPEVFKLPIVDHAECLRSRKEFLYITNERTLCAGLRNGTGPCTGDSGSGLLILSYNRRRSLVWHLRGLISLSLLDRKQQTCDLNEYIVFTDIARFTDWLNTFIT